MTSQNQNENDGETSRKPYIGRRTGKVIDIVARKDSMGFENASDYFPESASPSYSEKRPILRPKAQVAAPAVTKPYIGRRTGKVIDIKARINANGFENISDYFPDLPDSDDEQPVSQPVSSTHHEDAAQTDPIPTTDSKVATTQPSSTDDDVGGDDDQQGHVVVQSDENNDSESPDSAFGSTKDEIERGPPGEDQVDDEVCDSGDQERDGDTVNDTTETVSTRASVSLKSAIMQGGTVSKAMERNQGVIGNSDDDDDCIQKVTKKRLTFSLACSPDEEVKKNEDNVSQNSKMDNNNDQSSDDDDNREEDEFMIVERPKGKAQKSPTRRSIAAKKLMKRRLMASADEDNVNGDPGSAETFLTLKKRKSTASSQQLTAPSNSTTTTSLAPAVTVSATKATATTQKTQIPQPVRRNRTRNAFYKPRKAIGKVQQKRTHGKSEQDVTSIDSKPLPENEPSENDPQEIGPPEKEPQEIGPSANECSDNESNHRVKLRGRKIPVLEESNKKNTRDVTVSESEPSENELPVTNPRVKVPTRKYPAPELSTRKNTRAKRFHEDVSSEASTSKGQEPYENDPPTRAATTRKIPTRKNPPIKASAKTAPQGNTSKRRSTRTNGFQDASSSGDNATSHDSLGEESEQVPAKKIPTRKNPTSKKAMATKPHSELTTEEVPPVKVPTRNALTEKSASVKASMRNRRKRKIPTRKELTETEDELAPEEERPEVELPEDGVSEVELPEDELQEKVVPEVELPEAESPETGIQEDELPEVDLPEDEVPEEDILMTLSASSDGNGSDTQKKSRKASRKNRSKSRRVVFNPTVSQISNSPISAAEVQGVGTSDDSVDRGKVTTSKASRRKATPGKRASGKFFGSAAKFVDEECLRESQSTESDSEEEQVMETTDKSKRRSDTKLKPSKDSATEQNGPRRSRRHRIAPLQYWKNERACYERRQSGWTFSRVLSNPTPQPPPRKRRAATAPRRKKGGRARSDDNEDMDLSDYEIPEGLQPTTNPNATVVNPETKSEVKIKLIHTLEMSNLQPAFQRDEDNSDPESSPLFVEKFFSHSHFGAGELVLKPGAEKGRQHVGADTMVFMVYQGRVLATVHNDCFVLSKGASFFVPEGNVYNIKNVSKKRDARLFFTQIKV